MASTKLKPLSSVLGGVIKSLGLDDPSEGVLLTKWSEIVGKDVAAMCSIEKLKRGRLFLRVENPVWNYELSMRRETLRGQINAFLKEEKVTEVHVKLRNTHGR